MYFLNCVHVFCRVYRTLYITACGLTLLLCESACICNFYFRETKSCIDIDGLSQQFGRPHAGDCKIRNQSRIRADNKRVLTAIEIMTNLKLHRPIQNGNSQPYYILINRQYFNLFAKPSNTLSVITVSLLRRLFERYVIIHVI